METKNTYKLLGVFLLLLSLIGGSFLYASGYFHIIDSSVSPNGTQTTVYSKKVGEIFSDEDSFEIADRGTTHSNHTYTGATYGEMHWSPDGNYRFLSYYWDTGSQQLEVENFASNNRTNLSHFLITNITDIEEFQSVELDEYGLPIVSYSFEGWASDAGALNLGFVFNDTSGNPKSGSFVFDCDKSEISEINFL